MSEEKRIEVTHKNALILAVGILDTIAAQNRVMIQRLETLNGIISKIASVDVNKDNEQ